MGDIVRRKWMTMMDVHAGAVERVYGGPVGLVWEMLAGEETERETGDLAEQAGIGKGSRVLALLPGAGGAARRLSRDYGATAIGLVTVPQMVDEAVRQTEAVGLVARVDFQQGNALEMSFHDGIFDAAWGEDAWCYVVDKDRMISEIYRVLKPGGTLAFTDWVQIRASDEEWNTPETFRIFPHLETVESYANILERNGFAVTGRGEVQGDPSRRVRELRELLRQRRDSIIGLIGDEAYDDAREALGLWEKAAGRGLVGRGWLLAGKP
jgi:ubiquinone/menaquinone biosynthesis C-methylase UbiE